MHHFLPMKFALPAALCLALIVKSFAADDAPATSQPPATAPAQTTTAQNPVTQPASSSIYDIPIKDITGKDASLAPYKGQVLLIVNVASKCGFTPQYKGLEAVYEKYKDKGLVILGFPCNQFNKQEPGTDADIEQFCTSKFGVTFPMFDKIEVNGDNRHALYTQLASAPGFPGKITWNFNKFLIGRDGTIIKWYDSKVTPDSAELTQAIEAALAAK